MTNPKTAPSGRTPLLGDGGKPLEENPAPEPPPEHVCQASPLEQISPKPWRSEGVPLHHGKHAQARIEALEALANARRRGDNEEQREAARRLREMRG